MLPLFKVFALVTRVFTRPVLMHVKRYHKSSVELADSALARPFIALGNWQYRASMAINRRLLRVETDSDMFVMPLNTEIALETGIELFYEIAVYALVLAICIYEMRKHAVEARIGKEKKQEHVERIERKLEAWTARHQEQEAQLKDLEKRIVQANYDLLWTASPGLARYCVGWAGPEAV